MKIYYLNSIYQTGKHRIVAAVYDVDAVKFDESTLMPFSTLLIDEAVNKPLCMTVSRDLNKTDVNGENRYHINGTGTLTEITGWVEYIPPRI